MIEASDQWFPVLKSSLLAIQNDEQRLNENRWNSFKENTLAVRIHTLEGFLKLPRSNVPINPNPVSPTYKSVFFATPKEECSVSQTPSAFLATVPPTF